MIKGRELIMTVQEKHHKKMTETPVAKLIIMLGKENVTAMKFFPATCCKHPMNEEKNWMCPRHRMVPAE